ncbi:MAG: hypothetical protein ACK4UO_07280 [Pseudolabrys sp.]
MKLKNFGYAALIAVAATAFTLASATTSEAKKHTKKAKAAAPVPTLCWGIQKPVCATKGGMKFTYANACYARNDGAKVVSDKACPAKKAKKAKKAGKKPAKKAGKKK